MDLFSFIFESSYGEELCLPLTLVCWGMRRAAVSRLEVMSSLTEGTRWENNMTLSAAKRALLHREGGYRCGGGGGGLTVRAAYIHHRPPSNISHGL